MLLCKIFYYFLNMKIFFYRNQVNHEGLEFLTKQITQEINSKLEKLELNF